MPSFDIENTLQGVVAGIDEVGCGPWAGPVVSCAVVFHRPEVAFLRAINDSKKLSIQKRNEVFSLLMASPEISWGVGCVDNVMLDAIGLAKAITLAHVQAFHCLREKVFVAQVLVDGIRNPGLEVPTVMVVKGDQLSYSIAAASIIAKVIRDTMMHDLHGQYPQYGWDTNMGYGTKGHQLALAQYGVSPYHRKSFKPVGLLLTQS